MKIKFILISLFGFMIFSCAPSIYTNIATPKPALSNNQNIIVLDEKDIVPKNSILLGSVKLGDSGFTTNCGFETMIEIAKSEARKAGGNAIKITEHILPSIFGSSCHRITANILDINDKISSDIVYESSTDTIKKLNINDNTISKADVNQFDNNKINHFMISFNYGVGYRTADSKGDLSSAEKELINQLSSGKTYEIKVGYKRDKNTFYGIIYSNFDTKALINNVNFIEPNGFVGSGNIIDKANIYFIGAGGGVTEKGFMKNDTVNFDMYLGYIKFSDTTTFKNSYSYTGGNLGISTSLSYYLGLNNYIKFGPSISFNGGVLKGFDVKGDNGYSSTIKLPEKTVESLYRFDLMLGTYIQF